MIKKEHILISSFILTMIAHSLNAQIIQGAIQAGGAAEDAIFSIDRGPAGNIYTTGYFESNPAYFGNNQLNNNGGKDLFVSKFNPSGTNLWSVRAGFGSDQIGRDVVVDNSGNVYVCGYFQGSMFFFTPWPWTFLSSSGGHDVFLLKYNSNGQIQWAKSIGTAGDDKAHSIAVGPAGNVYVTGFYVGPDNSRDAFILKYNSGGTLINYILLNGAGEDEIRGVGVDNSGNVIIGGFFNNDLNMGGQIINSTDNSDIFIAKYNSSLTLQWVRTAGNVDKDYIRDLEVSQNGAIYISGAFRQRVTFPLGHFDAVGNNDNYLVAKYNNNGAIQWVHTVGGSGNSVANAIDVDDAGDAYVIGRVSDGAIFGPGDTVNTNGLVDIFVSKYSNSGSLLWRTLVGGTSDLDIGYGVSTNNQGTLYTGGQFRGSVDFNGTTLVETSGSNEMFLAGFNDASQQFTQLRIDAPTTIVNFSGDQMLFSVVKDEESSGTYEWFKNGNSTGKKGAEVELSIQNGDSVQLVKQLLNGSQSFSNPIIMNVITPTKEKGLASIEKVNNNTLTVDYGVSYKWYDADSNLIESATGNTFSPNKPGIYHVEITDQNGFIIKESYNFKDVTGEELAVIYPNPVIDHTTIQSSFGQEVLSVDVMDQAGRLITTYKGNGSEKLLLSLTDFPQGIYIAKITTSEGVSEQKLIKQ